MLEQVFLNNDISGTLSSMQICTYKIGLSVCPHQRKNNSAEK